MDVRWAAESGEPTRFHSPAIGGLAATRRELRRQEVARLRHGVDRRALEPLPGGVSPGIQVDLVVELHNPIIVELKLVALGMHAT